MIVVGQWNLAGINEEPFEFRQNLEPAAAQTNLAIDFAGRLSALIEGVIFDRQGCPVAECLAGASVAAVLAPLQALTDFSALAAGLHNLANPEVRVAHILRDVARGDKAFSKGNMAFVHRDWGILKFGPANAFTLAKVLSTGDRQEFWQRWISSVEKAYPDALERIDTLLPLATFEGILLEAAVGIIEEDTSFDVDAFGKSLTCFVQAMCVDATAKTLHIARILGGVGQYCRPDIWCFQEFNRCWLNEADFSRFWENEVINNYVIFSPAKVKNPAMVTQLLIRKSRVLTIDMDATTRVSNAVASSDLVESLRPTFERLFGSAVAGPQLAAAVGPEGFLVSKLALAVCIVANEDSTASTHRARPPLLVVAGHASSDGTNNRALVAAAQQLAEREGCHLILGVDANTAAQVRVDLVEKGAAGQKDFCDFLCAEGFKHCYTHIGAKAMQDPQQFNTVRKWRSYVQCQLQKADKPDISAKDFVLSAGAGIRHLKGIRVNTFAWLTDERPDVLAGSDMVPILPEECSTWSADASMPSPVFASDHAMVLAQAVL